MTLTTLAIQNAGQFIDLSGLPSRQTRTMQPGETVAVGYRNSGTLCVFMGISHNGAEVVWDSTRAAMDAEFEMDELHAHFRDLCHGYEFTACRYNGRWVVPASGDQLQIKRVDREEAEEIAKAGMILDAPRHFRPRRLMGA